VGFASADQAAAAVNYFNKSFMDAMRLEVEFAYKFGSQQKDQQKAWSKYTVGTSAFRRQQEASGANGTAIGDRHKKPKKPEEKGKAVNYLRELFQAGFDTHGHRTISSRLSFHWMRTYPMPCICYGAKHALLMCAPL